MNINAYFIISPIILTFVALTIGAIWSHFRNKHDQVITPPTVEENFDEAEPISQPQTRSSLADLGFDPMENILPPQVQTVEPAPIAPPAPPPEVKMTAPPPPPVKKPEALRITSLHIMAPPGEQFLGYELLQALLAAELRHGAMNIFHRHELPHGEGAVLFSVAQATEPGIFDLSKMGSLACNGLTLFMKSNSSEVYELMLETAYQLAEDLGGAVLDANRQPLREHA